MNQFAQWLQNESGSPFDTFSTFITVKVFLRSYFSSFLCVQYFLYDQEVFMFSDITDFFS